MRPIRTIRNKLILRFSLLFALAYLLIVAVIFFGVQHLTLQSAKESALTIAKTTRDALTSFMVLGEIQNRHVFIQELTQAELVAGVQKIKVLRSQIVVNQFGKGQLSEKAETELEKRTLASGEISERSGNPLTNPVLELVIPYKAKVDGSIQCLQCHQAEEGDVLGAISLVYDLSRQGQRLSGVLAVTAGLSLLFLGVVFALIYQFTDPYSRFLGQLKQGFSRIEQGKFNGGFEIQTDLVDEAGEVADSYNRMSKKLYTAFKEISDKIYLLMGIDFSKSGNRIEDTLYNVEQLAKIYHFKHRIEQNRDRKLVFLEIQKLLVDLGIQKFSIYEIDIRRNSFELAASKDVVFDKSSSSLQGFKEKGPTKQIRCDQPILEELNHCHAKKTRGIVDSINNMSACPIFSQTEAEGFNFRCIPVVGSGVGLIVQLMYPSKDSNSVLEKTGFIQGFLNEALNILEVSAAMDFIREQSLVDELTGLYNRRYLEGILEKIVELTNRNRTHLGFFMLDVDHFKMVNDDFGHDAGDLVLKNVAKVIKESVRESDIVVRFGGEEVLILAINMAPGSARGLAEKIRKNVEESVVPYQMDIIKKTVSIGCADFPKDAKSFWSCVKLADMAMYEAKAAGRNQVVVHDSTNEKPGA